MANPDIHRVLAEFEPSEISDDFYRHTAPGRQALSGRGAGLAGGRWNPPGLETVYLAKPWSACHAEFIRMVEGQAAGPASFLPRTVHTVAVTGLIVVDLTTEGAMAAVGLSQRFVESVGVCRQIGDAANTLGFDGVVAPSAAGTGEVLAVFPSPDAHEKLTVRESRSVDNEQWY